MVNDMSLAGTRTELAPLGGYRKRRCKVGVSSNPAGTVVIGQLMTLFDRRSVSRPRALATGTHVRLLDEDSRAGHQRDE
jgi:hypothetical protein